MKEIHDYQQDIATIRSMMERSGKFLSLSGMSGVMAGIYALGGAAIAYYKVHYPASPLEYRAFSVQDTNILKELTIIATIVLVASIATGLWLSGRKAKKSNTNLWNSTTKILFVNLGIPLITGGLFVLILLNTGHFGIAAPACLVFYGLALINASANMYKEIRYLGISEIILGLISATIPGYGLIFWAFGFGVLHIIYGTVMYYRYDK
jgi:hypothetical protein